MGMKRRGLAHVTAVLAVIVMVIFTGCPDDAEEAKFEIPRYNITVQTGANGSIKANPRSAVQGANITLTITPNTGYSLKESSLKVKQANGTEVTISDSFPHRICTFTMPASNVTVRGEFEEFDGLPNDNNLTISFENFDNEDIDLTRDHQNDLVIGSNQTLQIEVLEDYDNYHWYINGEPLIGGSRTFTFDMSADIFRDADKVGVHTITVVVQKGSIFYSKSLTFRVVL